MYYTTAYLAVPGTGSNSWVEVKNWNVGEEAKSTEKGSYQSRTILRIKSCAIKQEYAIFRGDFIHGTYFVVPAPRNIFGNDFVGPSEFLQNGFVAP